MRLGIKVKKNKFLLVQLPRPQSACSRCIIPCMNAATCGFERTIMTRIWLGLSGSHANLPWRSSGSLLKLPKIAACSESEQPSSANNPLARSSSANLKGKAQLSRALEAQELPLYYLCAHSARAGARF
jgi:hypothetical protein